MRDIRPLEDRLDLLLTASTTEREARQLATRATMEVRDAEDAAFALAAARLQADVILPRIDAIARRFPQAVVDRLTTPDGMHVRCRFPRSEQYPATVTLTVGVLHDHERGVASVFHSVDIVPMLGSFDRGAHLDLPMRAAERGDADGQAASFLEEALLQFVGHFLSLETDPQYQHASTTLDPVCRMAVSGATAAATAEHARTRYLFCSVACRDKFVVEPERYLKRPLQLHDHERAG